MSEKVRVTVKCPSCGQQFILTRDNSRMVIFEKAVFMSYWAVVCNRRRAGTFGQPRVCREEFNLWVSVDQDEARDLVHYFREEDWPIVSTPRPSQKVITDYEESVEFKLEVENDLSPNLQKEVAAFGAFLRDLPPEVDLVDLVFSTAPPKPNKPYKWR